MPSKHKRGRRLLIRCAAFFTVAGSVVLFLAIDNSLKTTSTLGHCPPSPPWIVSSGDFGGFWSRLQRLNEFQAIQKETPGLLASVELYVYKITRIRPTPVRWQLWMGRQFLMTRSTEGVGLCVRPGLLMHLADIIDRLARRTENGDDGIRRIRDIYFAWREGFLILSESRTYVAASLVADPVQSNAPDERSDVRLAWTGDHAGSLTINAEPGIPITGTIAAAITDRSTPLSEYDRDVLISVSASKWSDIRVIAEMVDLALAEFPAWSGSVAALCDLWKKWNLEPPQHGWDSSIDQIHLAVSDIDTSEALPIPIVDMRMTCQRSPRGEHPFAPLLASLHGIPSEWEDREGIQASILGEKATLCVSKTDTCWLATTQSQSMSAMIVHDSDFTSVDDDVILQINWEKVGHAVESVVIDAGKHQILPGLNKDDITASLAPYAKGIATLGRASLLAQMQDGELHFIGKLSTHENRSQK